jgi:Uma2 family endonuclease
MAVPLLKGLFTVAAYQRLAELGVLREDDRVELIDGQVVEMTPIGDRHAACVRRLNDTLSHDLRGVAIVDVQNPVVLDEYDVPQPDLAVLKRRADRYPSHPRAADVLLVIEVAETSLAYDRDIKIPLYARAGMPEAWLVDLTADGIWVYREPVAGRYTSVRLVSRGDAITPLHFPSVTLSTDEVLG